MPPKPPLKRVPPPLTKRPLLSETIADAPTQRLYIVAAFVLQQSFKLSDVVFPPASSPLAPDLNWRLVKWIALDLLAVVLVAALRVPRLDFAWRGKLVLSVLLIALDWALFGNWKYTVHILAGATAHLNPSATCYCIPSNSNSPILLPLLLNNSLPSSLTYEFTPLHPASTAEPKLITVPFSTLLLPSSAAIPERDELDEWLLGPSPSSAKGREAASPRHKLPSSSAQLAIEDGTVDETSHLAPTQKLYYLPITTPGTISLKSLTDASGHPIKIRHSREQATAHIDARITPCARGGFEVVKSDVVHTCLASPAESRSLGLKVSGWQPLDVKWHVKVGAKDDLKGITSGSEGGVDVIAVPLNVTLGKVGRVEYVLDHVQDGCGNGVTYGGENKELLLPGTKEKTAFVVHQPPEIAFTGACGKGEDVRLLKGGRAVLEMKLSAVKVSEGESWWVKLRYTAENGGKPREEKIEARRAQVQWEAKMPGVYEIVEIGNEWCSGSVLVPSTCHVVLQPEPTLSVNYSPLLDVCNAEIGSTATLHLTGAPPFAVTYTLTSLDTKRVTTKTVQTSSRHELVLDPGPGEWEYKFVRVKDKYYEKGVALGGGKEFTRRQKVQLVGGAEWKGTNAGKTVQSCEGEFVMVDLALKGSPPWDVEYSVVGQPTQILKGITDPNHSFNVAIPPPWSERGGQFSLSLESVTDGNKCRRPLAAQDLLVDVRKTKPTARFHGAGGSRSAVIRATENARIPLRLTGEKPWTIKYSSPPPLSNPNARPSIHEFQANQQNVDLVVSNPMPGVYHLISVEDKYCAGIVSETDWTVSTFPRPTLKLAAGAGTVAKNGSVIRPPVCENTVDSVSMLFEGKPPFRAAYTLAKGSHQAERHARTLQAIHSRADLTLFTAEAGHQTYHFTGVGDSIYTEPAKLGLIPPAGGKDGLVRVEQDVFPLPTATWKSTSSKLGFCVNDRLASRNADDLVLKLEGRPPFAVELEVREEGVSHTEKFTIDGITKHEWPVVVPFELARPAPYAVHIRHVTDANGCDRIVDVASPVSTQLIQVSEIATITPVLPQHTHCVGDFLDFAIQGAPPFTVAYEFNGKPHVVQESSATFSRVAASAGEFKILSVGHGSNECRSNEVNLVKQIFPIPSAQVSHGEEIIVDLHEGDQTEIVFNFSGTPPFSFTYSRRHPQDRTKDRTVLETHSVTGIMDYSYSIFTSQEGTWSVSHISDAHCAYPPPTPRAALEK
ncbi:nucleoporin Pom152 [Pseudohyphozyma bogoriensis]|nr:nucleoporin Pom152 [Pseudohyphozyma bogoriensis]